MLTDNVVRMLEGASEQAYEEGIKWYPDAHKWASFKAGQYDVPIEVVAGVISALSPRNKWERNLYDADQLLMCYERGDHDPEFVVSGTFRKNVMRAWIVRDKLDASVVMTSPKTEAFVNNITWPKGPDVTVDSWAYRIAEGDLSLPAKSIGKRAYEQYAEAYREVALTVGLRPCEVQAITWVEARHRVKSLERRAGMSQLRMF